MEAAHDGPSAQPAPAAATASSATDSDGKNSPRTGLVMAVPRVVKVADVDAVTNLIWISGWALLGVIVYSPSRKKITTAWRGPGSANSRRDNSADRQVEVKA